MQRIGGTKTYPSGFHVILNQADATKYLNALVAYAKYQPKLPQIKQVRWRHRLAGGTLVIERIPVIVARFVKIID